MHRLGRAATFLAGSIIGGLALAFIIVFVHPQLLQRPASAPSQAAAAAPPAPVTPDTSATTPAAAPQTTPAGKPVANIVAGTPGHTGDVIRGPEILRPTSAPAPTPGNPTGVPAESYAAAVRRAAPAVVNISTARLVTEQVGAQLFGDLRPLYRRRVERALGSGVIADAGGHCDAIGS